MWGKRILASKDFHQNPRVKYNFLICFKRGTSSEEWQRRRWSHRQSSGRWKPVRTAVHARGYYVTFKTRHSTQTVGILNLLHCYSYKVILVAKYELTLFYYKAKEMGISTKFVSACFQICTVSWEDTKTTEISPFLSLSWPSGGTREVNLQTRSSVWNHPPSPELASFAPRRHDPGAVHTEGCTALVAHCRFAFRSISEFSLPSRDNQNDSRYSHVGPDIRVGG